MHTASTEKKLELLKRIREESQVNQNTVKYRESILYGKDYKPIPVNEELENTKSEKDNRQLHSTFKVRFVCAILLMASFIMLDYTGQDVFGISAQTIADEIVIDFGANVFDFMRDFTYTLK